MAIHSSNLVWKTPRTKEHGGLQSTESQRAGHDTAHTARVCVCVSSFFPELRLKG